MKILASSVLMYAYKIQEILPLVKEWGYDGVEIWHFHLLQTHESPLEIRHLAQDLELDLSLHSLSWDLNYTSRLSEVREASLVALEGGIRLAKTLGAHTVVVHPGRVTIPQEDPELSWPDLIGGTRRMATLAEDLGIRLSVEIMEHIPKEFFINPWDADRLLKAISNPALSITVDSAHVPWNTDLVEYMKATPKVEHLHISDSTDSKLHLPLGKGERDHHELLRYIKTFHPEIPIVIEGMAFNREPDLTYENLMQLRTWLGQL